MLREQAAGADVVTDLDAIRVQDIQEQAVRNLAEIVRKNAVQRLTLSPNGGALFRKTLHWRPQQLRHTAKPVRVSEQGQSTTLSIRPEKIVIQPEKASCD